MEWLFSDSGLGLGRILGYVAPPAIVVLLIVNEVRRRRWLRATRQAGNAAGGTPKDDQR